MTSYIQGINVSSYRHQVEIIRLIMLFIDSKLHLMDIISKEHQNIRVWRRIVVG